MKRSFMTLALIMLCTAALRADVTVTTMTSIQGGAAHTITKP